MDSQSDGELYAFENDVAPGYLCDITTKNIFPSEDAKWIKTKDQPISLDFDWVNRERLSSLQEVSEKDEWMKDYISEKAVDALMIRGSAYLERRGIDVPPDDVKHRVTSVYYHNYPVLLILFSKDVPEKDLNEFKKHIFYLLQMDNFSIFPDIIREHCKCVYIYHINSKSGKKFSSPLYATFEYCRLLQDFPINALPVSALIKAPRPSYASIMDSTMKDTLSKSLEYCVRLMRCSQDDMRSDGTIITSIDELPQGHSNENLQQEVRHGKGNCDKSESSKECYGKDFGKVGQKDFCERNLVETNVCSPSKIQENCSDNVVNMTTRSEIIGPKEKKISENILEKDGNMEIECLQESYQNDLDRAAQKDICEKNDVEANVCNLNKRQEKYSESNLNKNIQGKMIIPEEEPLPDNIKMKDDNMGAEGDNQNPLYLKSQNGETGEKILTIEAKTHDNDTNKIETLVEPGNVSKMDSEKEVQDSLKDKQNRLKQSSSMTSITEKQKKIGQGFGCEGTDEAPVFKVTEDSVHNEKRKQKLENKKSIQIKSTLLKPVKEISDSCGLKRKYYGVLNDTYPEKVIIFLGATGSGKTMLINFIANFFEGRKTPDNQLIHVENTLPTSEITAYTFCSSLDEIPITIIDTPGLNDSSGAEVRDHVQSLKTFLANASSKGFQIHAIGFVAQAYLVRLTSSERLVMDYVSTMFGQSVSEHLITLVTFADNQDNPPVVEAMKNYGVKFKLFLKFNTSALSNTKSQEKDDQSDELDKAYWRVCRRNWKKCLKIIKDLPPLSVKTMKALQSEVYATTVIESAERDLHAELKVFFTFCKKETYMSNDAIKVCEQIWELGSLVHRLRSTNDIMKYSLNTIITELSIKTCETLGISAESYVSILSLRPSGSLVASGLEIIHAMAPLYEEAKDWHSDSETVSKNITKWAYCQRCKRECQMDRYDPGAFVMWGQPKNILILKCLKCKCPGGCHTVRSVISPFHHTKILERTLGCIWKAIIRHSLPGYRLPIRILLQFLHRDPSCEHKEFVKDLLKRI